MNGRKAKLIRKASGIGKKGSKYKNVPLLDEDGNQVMGTITRGKEVIEYPRYTSQLQEDLELNDEEYPSFVIKNFQVRNYSKMKNDYTKGILSSKELNVLVSVDNGE